MLNILVNIQYLYYSYGVCGKFIEMRFIMFKSLNRIFIVCFLSLFMTCATFVIAQAATLVPTSEDQKNQVIEVLEVGGPAFLPLLVPEDEEAEVVKNILQVAGVLTNPLLGRVDNEINNATGRNSNVAKQLLCILIQYNNNPDFLSDPSFDPAPSCNDSDFVEGVLAGRGIENDLGNLKEVADNSGSDASDSGSTTTTEPGAGGSTGS